MKTEKSGSTTFLGYPLTVFLLGVVSLCNDLSSEMIYPLLPVFLTQIGASVAFIGLIEGIAETTASMLKLFSGWIADRLNRKRTLTVFGYTLSNAVRPLICIASAGWHVLLFRFADRIGKGIRTSPRDAIIADSTPAESRGKAFGFNRAMDHGGAMLGSFVAYLLLNFVGLRIQTVFLLSAIPGILTILLIGAAIGTARDPGHDSIQPPKLSLAQFDRRFKVYLLIIGLFTLGNSSDAFLLLRAREVGMPISQLPLIWFAFHGVKSLTSGLGGAISDRLGRVWLIVAGWIIYAVVYLGFSQAGNPLHIWFLFTAYGVFFGLTEGTERAFVADLVPANLRGTAFGLYNFTIGIVALPASVLCGFLWQNYSSTIALGTGAGLAMIAAVVLIALFGQRTPLAAGS